MPTFLSDPTQTVYLILAVPVVVTGLFAARNQDRRSFVRFLIALGVLLLLVLIDWLFESPREEATRRVEAMTEAATAADPVRFIEHVSPAFSTGAANRDKLKTSGAWDMIRAYKARVAAWGFGHDACEYVSDTEVEIGFYVKAAVPSGAMDMRYTRARFVKDPDGHYRLKGLKLYNPADRGLNAEAPITGFP